MPQRAQREAAGLAGVLKTKSALLAWLVEQGPGKLKWAKAVQHFQALDCELPPDKTGKELRRAVKDTGSRLKKQLGQQVGGGGVMWCAWAFLVASDPAMSYLGLFPHERHRGEACELPCCCVGVELVRGSHATHAPGRGGG